MVGRGVTDDVGELDGGDHAEVKGLDDVGKVEAAGELVWCGPSSLIRAGRCVSSTDLLVAPTSGVGAAGRCG